MSKKKDQTIEYFRLTLIDRGVGKFCVNIDFLRDKLYRDVLLDI